MAEQYIWNGHGLNATYGVTVRLEESKASSDSFLAWPDRKPSLTDNRQDMDGLRIDLSVPVFEARQFVLKCALRASGREDYFNKYNGFRTEVTGSDTHDLYIAAHDKTYKVYYIKQEGLKTYNHMTESSEVWAVFDIILGETNPADNLEAVYLVDDQDRYLIA